MALSLFDHFTLTLLLGINHQPQYQKAKGPKTIYFHKAIEFNAMDKIRSCL
jgi:hypothetical protein